MIFPIDTADTTQCEMPMSSTARLADSKRKGKQRVSSATNYDLATHHCQPKLHKTSSCNDLCISGQVP